jgi:uroporphyrinogen-III synthase
MKKVLYTGIEKPAPVSGIEYIHYPLIRIVPRPWGEPAIQKALEEWPAFTHVVFTSKTAVDILCKYLQADGMYFQDFPSKQYVSVGQATARRMNVHGVVAPLIAQEETAEGIIKILEKMDLTKAYLFWPHSAISRPVLSEFFLMNGYRFMECILYDTLPNRMVELPSWEGIEEIVFTSPSTVFAFLEIFGVFPEGVALRSIGPVTANVLQGKLFYV